MNMRNALLSMLAAGAIVPMAANAVTYYVAENGYDGADGSSATPFATIAKGVSAATASSDGSKRVIVKSGTYKIDSAIEIGAALTVESETGDPADVIIDGQGITPLVKWTDNLRATLSGLTLTNGYALRRMARHLNHRGQRRYRLKFADTYYGELNHYGMYWLRWADVRRRRY